MSLARLSLLPMLLATTAGAQQIGSYTNFGSGCSGSLGTPTIQGSLPTLGRTLLVNVNNAPGLVVLTVGLAPASIPLDALGAPGCSLLTSADVTLVGAAIQGIARFPIPIPNDPGLNGATVFNQGIVIDPAANNLGLTTTGGGRASIGSTTGVLPMITGISDSTPLAGATVIFTGANFAPNARAMCDPGFFPVAVNADGTELIALVADAPGTFDLEVGVLTGFDPFGVGGMPFQPVPNLQAPADAFGVAGALDPATVVRTGQRVTIMPNPAQTGTRIPVQVDPTDPRRICMDFTGTDWTGGEKVEIELHFDITPPPANGRPHCDFYTTKVCSLAAGPARQCATSIAFWITIHLATQCPGLSIQLDPNPALARVYLVAPGGSTFRNPIHSLSHVVVY